MSFLSSKCGFEMRASPHPHPHLPDASPRLATQAFRAHQTPQSVLPPRCAPGLARAQVTLFRAAGSSSLGSHPDCWPGSPGARRCAPSPAGSDRPQPVWEAAPGSRSPALPPALPRILSLRAESGCGRALNCLVAENPPSFQDSSPRFGRRRLGTSPLGH